MISNAVFRHREPSYHIAIVGGGQAAKALLMLLAERAMGNGAARPDTRVVIFERSRHIGPGSAWGPGDNLPEHLSSQPGGASRPEFGRRQIQVMVDLVGTLRSVNVHVDMVPGVEIIDLRRLGTDWVLLGEQSSWRATVVVLATGHWRNTPRVLEQIPHEYPWPATALQDKIDSRCGVGARIAVLGAYHTAIDTALTVALTLGRFEEKGGELRYEARQPFTTTLLSRTGRLPLVWPPAISRHELRATELMLTGKSASTPLRFDELMPFLCRQLHDEHVCSATSAARHVQHMVETIYRSDPVSRLERALRPEGWTGRNLSRIAAMATLLPQVSERFPFLDAESYQRFQRNQRTPFFNVAMPMARMTGARILALLRAGVLKVEAIGGCQWQMVGGQPALVDEINGPSAGQRSFDVLVNGLSSCGPISGHPGKLMRSLVRQQLIMPAYRRFAADDGSLCKQVMVVDGVHVDPASCEAISSTRGMSAARGSLLFTMGANNAGLFLDAQSVGQLARDARRIVSRLSLQQASLEVS